MEYGYLLTIRLTCAITTSGRTPDEPKRTILVSDHVRHGNDWLRSWRNILSREHPTFEAIQYDPPTDKDEMKTLRCEEQIKILDNDDIDEGSTRCSDFSFEEGPVWVPEEEEADPEEDPSSSTIQKKICTST